MSFDVNSLSSDPLFYFLAHSTLFVVIIAATFFIFGLMFGWLTWARYKRQRRRLLAEADLHKDEIVALKRKLAEQIARSSSLAEAEHQCLMNARSSLNAETFPCTTSEIMLSDRYPGTPDTAPVSDDQSATAKDTKKTREPVVASTTAVEPQKNVLQSLVKLSAGPSLTDQPGADCGLQQLPDHQPAPAPETSARLSSDPHLGLVYGERPPQSDALSDLKGVTSVIESRLNELGVYTFKQIGLLDDEHIREISNRLGFKDHIHREQWVDQARTLHFKKYGEQI